MTVIVDPLDTNHAIVDGELGTALRLVKIADPTAPRVSELSGGKVIGYVTIPRS